MGTKNTEDLSMTLGMRRMVLAVAVLGLVMAAATPANAGTWTFSYDAPTYSGPDTIASGTLTTLDVLNGDGSFTVTGITGTRTSYGVTDAITGLAPIGSYGGNDNELFALPSPQLTGNGMTFFISNPSNGNDSNQVNIFYYDVPGYGYGEYSDDDVGTGTFTATPTTSRTATPAPSTLVTSSILLGLFGVVWLYKRLKNTPVNHG